MEERKLDPWLMEHLVCPRDHSCLRIEAKTLLCDSGHRYPIIDGIPVMLLGDVEQTIWHASRTLEQAASVHAEPGGTGVIQEPPIELGPDSEQIHPHVLEAVAATGGNLYRPLVGNLSRYPIPEIRLPESSGSRLLDIGCNWGRWCISAARKGYQPVGVDVNLNALCAARMVSRQLGVSSVFVVADSRFLPFSMHSFDVVFSYSVLQHFSKANVRLTLGKIAGVLRPSGACMIQMPNVYGIRSLYQQMRRGFHKPSGFDVRYWTLSELVRTFEDSVGPTSISVDGYFGLGIQKSDIDLMPFKYRLVVNASERMRSISKRLPWMVRFADSVYVTSIRR